MSKFKKQVLDAVTRLENEVEQLREELLREKAWVRARLQDRVGWHERLKKERVELERRIEALEPPPPEPEKSYEIDMDRLIHRETGLVFARVEGGVVVTTRACPISGGEYKDIAHARLELLSIMARMEECYG